MQQSLLSCHRALRSSLLPLSPLPLRLAQLLGSHRMRPLGSQLGRRRLVAVPAQVEDNAVRALGLPRLAHIAAVQNQPMMRAVFVMRRGHFFETAFDLQRSLAGREAGAVADAED